ncbi:hypothetical protein GCK72_013869 [Caenorhabditis remanei]|uniref:Uncharacterized protein n=1 Tax=Caenorhabditis remanei TaxID=31234 RepID=A0A6A5GSA3_CAERE|nr:hypothetical protein GCK72_013869 [Caenorhabditis remanei]KAF1757413.1 hypothetical protein GCK72_013869 [Caenorhabditis remanei]
MGVFWCFLGYYLCGPNKETIELSRKHVMDSFEEPIDNFIYLGGTIYTISNDGTIILHYKLLTAVSLMSSTVSISFIIITFCGLKCYHLIRNMIETSSTISAKSKSLQSQLFYALVIQIIIPTILLDIPITVFFMLTLTNNGIEGYSGYLSFLITLYPAIDPLPNFFVIIPYRKALLGCFRKQDRRITAETTVPPNSIHYHSSKI